MEKSKKSRSLLGQRVKFGLICGLLFLSLMPTVSFSSYAPLQEVLVSTSGNTLNLKVFDPRVNTWVEKSLTYAAPIQNLRVKDGMIAWNTTYPWAAVYDPSRGAWMASAFSRSYSGTPNGNEIQDGVVGFTNPYYGHVLSATYDPVEGRWKTYNGSLGTTKAGVVAGEYHYGGGGGYRFYMVYDPALHNWVSGSWPLPELYDPFLLTPLVVDDYGTVTWTYNGQAFQRGYDPVNHVWYDGPTLPLASFAVKAWASAGTLFAWFTDMSLGAKTWQMDFGDGQSTNLRSPQHVYQGAGPFTATQTVTGVNNLSNTTTRQVLVDNQAPTGAIVINNNDQFTNNRNVVLGLSATDPSGVLSMRFSTDGTTWGAWLSYATSSNYTLPAGDGTKKVFVQFQDVWGLISATYNDSIILDTGLPSAVSLSINAGATYTNSVNVNLTLSATDTGSGVTQMRILNDSIWGPWIAYATASNVTLPAGDGTKTVGAQFMDAAGNVSSNAYASIILDSTKPASGSMVINGNAFATRYNNVTLTLQAADPSGVKQMRFRQSDAKNLSPWGAWVPFAASSPCSLLWGEGRKWVGVQFMDNAGNISAICLDDIILDRTPPTTGTLQAIGGSGQVSLSWSGFSDTRSGIEKYIIVFSTKPFIKPSLATWIYEGLGTSFTHTNLNPQTTYYYRIYARDKAGNLSTVGIAAQATTAP